MNPADRQQVVKELFESPLPRRDVDSFLERALDERYWKQLNSELSIGADRSAAGLDAAPLDPLLIAAHRHRYDREGYFYTAPVVGADALGRMCAAIEALRAERWPPVFSFVYDEFWEIVRTPSLVTLLTGLLGAGFTQNTLVWVFYVASARGAQGWSPHMDGSADPPRMTVWVPLTDATVENGCMYVMPADRFADDLRRKYFEPQDITQTELHRLLQSARALPSPAGAYLGWNHDLLHWGSVSDGGNGPRIAVGLEFLGPGVAPHPGESPLLNPLAPPPPFSERLRAIAKSLFAYQKYEPANRRYTELARLLFETSPA